LFIYIVKGKADEGKNRICFQRIPVKSFLNCDHIYVIKTMPDPAIGKIDDSTNSGLIKVRIKLDYSGKNINCKIQ